MVYKYDNLTRNNFPTIHTGSVMLLVSTPFTQQKSVAGYIKILLSHVTIITLKKLQPLLFP